MARTLALTGGYPFYIQEFGKHIWNTKVDGVVIVGRASACVGDAARARRKVQLCDTNWCYIYAPIGGPFIYEEPLKLPDQLADRTAELALLRERAGETRNSRLEGPRRYGKTSLVKAALDAADKDGFVPIYVNFLGVLTAADVADRIERSVY